MKLITLAVNLKVEDDAYGKVYEDVSSIITFPEWLLNNHTSTIDE